MRREVNLNLNGGLKFYRLPGKVFHIDGEVCDNFI